MENSDSGQKGVEGSPAPVQDGDEFIILEGRSQSPPARNQAEPSLGDSDTVDLHGMVDFVASLQQQVHSLSEKCSSQDLMIKELKESTQALQSESDAGRSGILASPGVGTPVSAAVPAPVPVDLLSSVSPLESDASVILLEKSDAKPQLSDMEMQQAAASIRLSVLEDQLRTLQAEFRAQKGKRKQDRARAKTFRRFAWVFAVLGVVLAISLYRQAKFANDTAHRLIARSEHGVEELGNSINVKLNEYHYAIQGGYHRIQQLESRVTALEEAPPVRTYIPESVPSQPPPQQQQPPQPQQQQQQQQPPPHEAHEEKESGSGLIGHLQTIQNMARRLTSSQPIKKHDVSEPEEFVGAAQAQSAAPSDTSTDTETDTDVEKDSRLGGLASRARAMQVRMRSELAEIRNKGESGFRAIQEVVNSKFSRLVSTLPKSVQSWFDETRVAKRAGSSLMVAAADPSQQQLWSQDSDETECSQLPGRKPGDAMLAPAYTEIARITSERDAAREALAVLEQRRCCPCDAQQDRASTTQTRLDRTAPQLMLNESSAEAKAEHNACNCASCDEAMDKIARLSAALAEAEAVQGSLQVSLDQCTNNLEAIRAAKGKREEKRRSKHHDYHR